MRWIPSTDQEVSTERAARQDAQAEVAELKERIAKAGVEHRRALHEAVLEEREACAKVCDREEARALYNYDNDLESNRYFWSGGGQIAESCAATIRARTT